MGRRAAHRLLGNLPGLTDLEYDHESTAVSGEGPTRPLDDEMYYDDDFLEGLPDDLVAALAGDNTAPEFVRRDARIECRRRGVPFQDAGRWLVRGVALRGDGKWDAFEDKVYAPTAAAAKAQVVKDRTTATVFKVLVDSVHLL